MSWYRMSCNVNSLNAMRTLLQQTQTGALDRTGAMLPGLSCNFNDMVSDKLGLLYKQRVIQHLRDADECTKERWWRVKHLKKIYWDVQDAYYAIKH